MKQAIKSNWPLVIAFITSLVAVFLTTGCAHYGHSHSSRQVPVYAGTPLYGLLTGTNGSSAPNPLYIRETKDRAGSTMFFVMGKAAEIKSMTKDEGGYEKQLDIGGLEGRVDGESIESAFKGLGAATGEAMRAYMGLPPLPIPASAAPATPAASNLINGYKANLLHFLPTSPVTPAPTPAPTLEGKPQSSITPPWTEWDKTYAGVVDMPSPNPALDYIPQSIMPTAYKE